MVLAFLSLVLLRCAGAAEFEWAGIFETPGDDYVWIAQKVSGSYADPSMKLVALPAASATASTLTALESEGKRCLDLQCQAVSLGDTIEPQDNTCYQLQFALASPTTIFQMKANGTEAIAFFTEHVPTEFESDTHYLKDAVGADVEPVAQSAGHAGHDHGGHDDHGDDHSGHDHGGGAYEWAGIFETPLDEYFWLAEKVDGKYADPAMKIVFLSAPSATASALADLESKGAELMAAEAITVIKPGEKLVPKEDTCYELLFDQDAPTTLFAVDGSGSKAMAIFAQHVPTEFERNSHYLKDAAGEDIEPMSELPEPEDHTDDAWGPAILASVIVNVMTLCGVVFLVPVVKRMSETYRQDFLCITSAFACGAIMSCAVFLLLFEATHLIAVDYTEEVEALWRWGTMILAGFFLPAIVQTVTAVVTYGKGAPSTASKGEGEVTKANVVSKSRICAGVLIGDFFHNLCDGFFLGAAFAGCGIDFGWQVAVGTIAHEFAQELADYTILTGDVVGLKAWQALALNFLSGTSVLLGTIIILASEVSQSGVGMLLAFGGGVYVHIACTDCMPRVYEGSLPLSSRLGCLLAFMIGAVGIGLVLLDHEHCVPGGGEHAHGGH